MSHLTPRVTDRIGGRAAPFTPLILRIGAVVLALGVGCRTARGQEVRGGEPRYYEQAALPAAHNWAFRRAYPEANGLLNAFDYGHAVLAERLHTQRADEAAAALEGKEYAFIIGPLFARGASLPLEEGALAPRFVRLAPEVAAMFEWAHMLHRQIYDVWADDRIAPPDKDARVAELLRYYRSRPDLAFSARPKAMSLMEGQPYSLAFRTRAPRFNGLVWSYHWLQMSLYDALLAGDSPAARRAAVGSVTTRFRAMTDAGGERLPTVMPMTAAIAPAFAARYPEAAVVFDNLHSLHDVVSDVLASPEVPRRARRATLLRAAAAYRDSTTAVTTLAEWREMSLAMGADRMGGVAFGAASPAGAHSHHETSP